MNKHKVKSGINIQPLAGSTGTERGDVTYNLTTNQLEVFTTSEEAISTTSNTQTLTNKTLTSPVITGATISGTFTGSPTFTGNSTFNGTVTISNSAATSALDVTSANGIVSKFMSSGANNATIVIDNNTGGFQSAISFRDAGSTKFQVGKNTDNTFFIFDQAHSRNSMTIDANGDVNFFPGGVGNAIFNTTPIVSSAGTIGVSVRSSANSGGSRFYELRNSGGAPTTVGWLMAADYSAANVFEITPSNVNGGNTSPNSYTVPAFKISSVGVVSIPGTTASTTSSNGALVVTGGVGIGGALNVAGTVAGSNISGSNTGDQTITLTGDVTGSGTGSFATTAASTQPNIANLSRAAGVAVHGTNTNDTPSAGYVGEIKSSIISFGSRVNLAGSGALTEITNITLTAGDWDISAMGFFHANGATSPTLAELYLATTSASTSGSATGDTQNYNGSPPITGGEDLGIPITPTQKLLSGSQTYYLNAQMNYTGGPAQVYGKIYARRMR